MRLGYEVLKMEYREDDIASMRPRRMRLGYESKEDLLGNKLNSFNEAEAHAPRIQLQP